MSNGHAQQTANASVGTPFYHRAPWLKMPRRGKVRRYRLYEFEQPRYTCHLSTIRFLTPAAISSNSSGVASFLIALARYEITHTLPRASLCVNLAPMTAPAQFLNSIIATPAVVGPVPQYTPLTLAQGSSLAGTWCWID